MFPIKRRNWWLVIAVSVLIAIAHGSVMYIPIARAEESVEFTVYWSSSNSQLTTGPKLTIINSDALGFVRSDNVLFNDLSFSSYCLWRIQPEGVQVHCYSKYMDADTHYFIIESMSGVGPKFLYGIGKFKGITGAGLSHDYLDNFQKPIRQGTNQGRVTLGMTYELPKAE